MRWRPDKIICEYEIADAKVTEEKFISASDAIASIITSSKPVTLKFSGHSFYTRNSASSSATIKHDKRNRALIISEGGTMKARPDPNGPERSGPSVYNDMSTVISSSCNITKTLITTKDENRYSAL